MRNANWVPSDSPAEAVHAAVQAIDHASRALTEVRRGRADLAAVDDLVRDRRLRREMSVVLDALNERSASTTIPPEELASIEKFRQLARLLGRLDADEVSLGLLANFQEELRFITAVVDPAALGRFRSVLSQMVTRKEQALLDDALGRLEEARLIVGNASLGFVHRAIEPVREAVRLDAVILDAQRELSALANSRQIRFENSLGPAKLAVVCVSDDVRRLLFMNLLHNALKYSDTLRPPRRAWIACRARRDRSGDLVVEVESWGTGINGDELERIFEPGVRGSASSRGGRTGAGLGLALAARVCVDHGWSIEVASVPATAGKTNPWQHRFITTAIVTVPQRVLWNDAESRGPDDALNPPLPD